MRTAAVFTLGLLATPLAAEAAAQSAEAQSADVLAARRATKLASPVFAKAGFVIDLAAARELAQRSTRPIFAYLTRSDATCPPCEALEAGPLSSPEFVAFARDVVPFLHCTSRTEGEPHPDLLAELGFHDFPALAFLDADGAVLARVDFEQHDVEAFRAILAGVQSYRAMCAALAEDGGEPDLHMRAELLVAQARLRRWTFQELDARMQVFGATLPAEHKRQLAPLRSELEFDWLTRLRDITPREKAARLGVFWRERRIPAGRRELSFWLEYGAAGKAVEDPTMLDLAAEVLESRADAPAGVATAYRKDAEDLRRR